MKTEPKPVTKNEPAPNIDEVDPSLASTGEFPHPESAPVREAREKDAVDRRVKDKPFRQQRETGTDGAE